MPAIGQDDKLELVRQVAEARRNINSLYVLIVKDAHADKNTLQSIGDAAGVGRSTIHTLIHGRAA
jgi:hypothetical protein